MIKYSMKINFFEDSDFKESIQDVIAKKSLIKKVFEKYLPKKEGDINVIFCSSDKIKNFNKKFRKKNEATDVLSFEINEEGVLGEVYISVDYLKASDRGDVNEILRMLIHGVLHLFGYEHEKHFDENDIIEEEMYMLQEKMLKEIV